MADNPNNPAGRLLLICNQFQSMKPTVLVKNAWAEIVGVPAEDMPELLSRIALCLPLIKAAKKSIYSINDIEDYDLFMMWETAVSKVFSQLNLSNGNIAAFKNLISPEVLLSLKHCDHELLRKRPEKVLDPEELQKIIDDINNLIDEVIRSDIEIKHFILDKLELLIRALEMYKYCGVQPINTAIESIVGATAIAKGEPYKKWKDDKVGGKFWDICGKLMVLTSLANNGIKMIEGSIGFLQ